MNIEHFTSSTFLKIVVAPAHENQCAPRCPRSVLPPSGFASEAKDYFSE
jgi:hypothetical protein